MENRSENSGQRTIHVLVVMSALALFLAVISLSIPLDVYAVGELAFIGSPTPPPVGTPSPPEVYPHTVTLVEDIYEPDYEGSAPEDFFIYNGELYFSATSEDEFGNYVWGGLHKYDGTSVSLVYDIRVKSLYYQANFEIYNGDLYFPADGKDGLGNHVGIELFRYDGVTAELIADIYPGPGSSSPSSLAVYNGELYFSAWGFDSNDDPVGVELFKYDGSQISLVEDLNPGIETANTTYLKTWNNFLYFQAMNNLYQYDGTDVQFISAFGPQSQPTEFQGMLYFAADGDDAYGNPVGTELFRLNGSTVELVADLAPGSYTDFYGETIYSSSWPEQLLVFDNKLFFAANGDLYSYDGSEIIAIHEQFPWLGHPKLWLDDGSYLNLKYLIADVNALYFYAYFYDNYDHSLDLGLYRFDGARVEFIEPLRILDLLPYGSEIMISADDRSGIGVELWKLDNIPDRETDTEILYSAPDIVEVGEPFKARVSVQTGDGGTPTGIVDVGDGGGNNCQITLVNGGGSCTLTLTEIGFQPIYARYQWGTEYLSSSDEDYQAVAPLPPASIDATYRTDPDIQVSWDPAAGATFYKLYRATSALGVQEDVYTGTDVHFTDTGVGFQDYYYWVRACYDVICSDQAGHVIGARQDLIPPAGSFTAPLQNGSLGIPRGLIKVNAFDGETGVQAVSFWIDKGSGWELLGTDTDGTDGWMHQLSTVNLGVNPIKLQAVISDHAGNAIPVKVGNISFSAVQTNLGGYEARGGSDAEAGAPDLSLPAKEAGYPSGPSGIKITRFILME